MCLANGSLDAAPPFPPAGSRQARFPRPRQYYEGATTSHPRIHGRLLLRCRSPRRPPSFVLASRAPGTGGGPDPGQGLSVRRLSLRSGLVTRGRQWDLSGLQAIHPVPLRRSRTPVEPTWPRHSRPHRCCPRQPDGEGFGNSHFGATTPLRHPLPYASRFASPLACKACFRPAGSRLYRKGVEPSGPQ
jgi:hypothetical protein